MLPRGSKSFQNKIAFNVQHGHSYKRCQKGIFIRYNLLLPKGFLLEVCQRGPHLYVLGSPLSGNLLSVCCFQNKFFSLISSLFYPWNNFKWVWTCSTHFHTRLVILINSFTKIIYAHQANFHCISLHLITMLQEKKSKIPGSCCKI